MVIVRPASEPPARSTQFRIMEMSDRNYEDHSKVSRHRVEWELVLVANLLRSGVAILGNISTLNSLVSDVCRDNLPRSLHAPKTQPKCLLKLYQVR